MDSRLTGRSQSIPAGVAGLLAVALNVVAVAALQPVPHTYRPGNLPAWHAELLAAPTHTLVSAWAFTAGLVALAAFAAGLALAAGGSRRNLLAVGATTLAAGALLDAAGTLAPIAALHTSGDTAHLALRFTLYLDAAFNLCLAAALPALALALEPAAGWPRPLRWLGVLAGAASLPVTLQFHSDDFARLLAVAGPLWLAWVTWTSVLLLRRPRA